MTTSIELPFLALLLKSALSMNTNESAPSLNSVSARIHSRNRNIKGETIGIAIRERGPMVRAFADIARMTVPNEKNEPLRGVAVVRGRNLNFHLTLIGQIDANHPRAGGQCEGEVSVTGPRARVSQTWTPRTPFAHVRPCGRRPFRSGRSRKRHQQRQDYQDHRQFPHGCPPSGALQGSIVAVQSPRSLVSALPSLVRYPTATSRVPSATTSLGQI